MDMAQNLDNAFGWVYVSPDHRGKGLARVIAAPMFDAVQDENRIRFAFEINKGRPEEAIARRAGMKPALTEKRSRLSLPDLDWALMDTWVKRSEERAADYELLFFPGSIPDAHLEAFCELFGVMNTAPRDDYEEDDEIITPEMWRDVEAKEKAREREILVYVARHNVSGLLAGFTAVFCSRLQPDLIWQGDTGVDPAHRNRGLGRWLKAAMALTLRDSYPEARRIDTYNAGSNAPMLSINVEMGFRPVLIETVWQGTLATIRERLSV
jgi:GNAT superfamily N-acetyltransferase